MACRKSNGSRGSVSAVRQAIFKKGFQNVSFSCDAIHTGSDWRDNRKRYVLWSAHPVTLVFIKKGQKMNIVTIQIILGTTCLIAAIAGLFAVIQEFILAISEDREEVRQMENGDAFYAYYLGNKLVYVEVPSTQTHYAFEGKRRFELYVQKRKSIPHLLRTFRNLAEMKKELDSIGCAI